MGKWVKKKLGEDNLFDFIKGEQINGEKLSDRGLYPMYNGGIDPSGYLDVYNTKAPQIIMSEGGNSCGYVNYIIDDFWRGGHCYLVKVNHENLFDKLFLFHLLKFHEDSIMKLRVGSGLPNIQKKDLYKFPISYPSSLSEQRRIASILSSADKVIDSTQKLIAKYKQIKQGMMEDLLKPKEGWKLVKLGEVYNFKYGDGNTNPNNDGVYPIYGANGIIGGYTKFNAKDSVIIGHMGEYAGSVIWANGKHFVTYNGTITTIKDNDLLYDRFGYFVLLKLNIKKICAGSGQPFLSYDTLNKIEISVPDLSEQCRIASILSGIDKKIESEEKVLEKYKKIKKGLMEKLLNE